MKELDHKQVLEWMDEYLDGELDGERSALVKAHIDACPGCQAEMNWRRAVLGACAGLDEDIEVPEEARVAWRSAVKAESGKKRGVGRRWAAGIAAALALWLGATGVLRARDQLPQMKSAAVNRAVYDEADYEYAEYELDGGMVYDTASPMANAALFSDGAMEESVVVTSDEAAPAEEPTEAAMENVGEVSAKQPKVVKSAYRSMETTSYDADVARLDDLVAEYSAYFESRNESGRPLSEDADSGRSLNGVIRVPTASLDNFLKSLVAVGTTVQSRESATDVSDQYYDAQTHLTSLEMQLTRLQEMLLNASDTEDLLSIHDRIQEVEYEIEYLKGTIQGLDSQISYSKVTVDLTEISETQAVEKPGTSLNERVTRSFQDSVKWMKGFFQDALVVLAMIAPQLAIWVPALILVYIVYRLIRRAVRKRK